jgi:hypothetical protein
MTPPGPNDDLAGLDLPPIPSWSRLKIFLVGAIWTLIGTAGPLLLMIYEWNLRWKDEPIDWGFIEHVAIGNALLALIGYGRKYQALLSPPPQKPNLSIIQGPTPS